MRVINSNLSPKSSWFICSSLENVYLFLENNSFAYFIVVNGFTLQKVIQGNKADVSYRVHQSSYNLFYNYSKNFNVDPFALPFLGLLYRSLPFFVQMYTPLFYRY